MVIKFTYTNIHDKMNFLLCSGRQSSQGHYIVCIDYTFPPLSEVQSHDTENNQEDHDKKKQKQLMSIKIPFKVNCLCCFIFPSYVRHITAGIMVQYKKKIFVLVHFL